MIFKQLCVNLLYIFLFLNTFLPALLVQRFRRCCLWYDLDIGNTVLLTSTPSWVNVKDVKIVYKTLARVCMILGSALELFKLSIRCLSTDVFIIFMFELKQL